MGSPVSYPQNLQNWLGERSLRPDDPDDWRTIMCVASLEDRTAEIWQAMAGSAVPIAQLGSLSDGGFARWPIQLTLASC